MIMGVKFDYLVFLWWVISVGLLDKELDEEGFVFGQPNSVPPFFSFSLSNSMSVLFYYRTHAYGINGSARSSSL